MLIWRHLELRRHKKTAASRIVETSRIAKLFKPWIFFCWLRSVPLIKLNFMMGDLRPWAFEWYINNTHLHLYSHETVHLKELTIDLYQYHLNSQVTVPLKWRIFCFILLRNLQLCVSYFLDFIDRAGHSLFISRSALLSFYIHGLLSL